MTGPATGAPTPGTSLSGPGGNAAAAAGPDIFPPQNSTIPNYKSVGPFTGGSATDAIIRGAARTLPRILRGRIPLADLVTPTDEIVGATGVELPRTLGRSPSGPGITRGPVPVNAPIPTPFTQPQHPSTMRYPGWPTPPAPATAAPTPPYRPEDSPSFTRPLAPAVPPVRPAAAGPAAAKQQPNLGGYTMAQPNIDPLSRGGRRTGGPTDAPQMGVFGFDPNGPLFGRGAAPAATATAPLAAPGGRMALTGGNVAPGQARSTPVPIPVPVPVPRPRQPLWSDPPSSTYSPGGGQ